MNFYEHYNKFLKRLTLSEAEGDLPPDPNSVDTGEPGQEPDPNALPQPDENQELASPFDLTMANFILQISKLDQNDHIVKSITIPTIKTKLTQKGSNPAYILNLIKSIYSKFKHLINIDAAGLEHSESNQLGERLKTHGGFWAKSLVTILSAISHSEYVAPLSFTYIDEVTTENLEDFKNALKEISTYQ